MISEVDELIESLRAGKMSLDQVAQRFRERIWSRQRISPQESYLDLAARAQEDPEVYVAGSFDDVAAAHQDGRLSDDEYTVLSEAVAESKRVQDGRGDQ